MISITNPIDSNGVSPLKTNPNIQSSQNASFSNELASIMARKKIKEESFLNKSEDEKTETSTDLLNHLSSFANTPLNFTNSEIESASEILNAPNESIENLLENIRDNFMTGIKRSLLKLEQAIEDPKNKVPANMIKKFKGAINQIKGEYTLGFGVPFDSVDIEIVGKDVNDDLYNRLSKNLHLLPASLSKKIEQIL